MILDPEWGISCLRTGKAQVNTKTASLLPYFVFQCLVLNSGKYVPHCRYSGHRWIDELQDHNAFIANLTCSFRIVWVHDDARGYGVHVHNALIPRGKWKVSRTIVSLPDGDRLYRVYSGMLRDTEYRRPGIYSIRKRHQVYIISPVGVYQRGLISDHFILVVTHYGCHYGHI